MELDETGLNYQRQTNGIFLLELRDFMNVSNAQPVGINYIKGELFNENHK